MRDRRQTHVETPLLKLPGFLIIGAMKSGTTSLYRDLQLNPNIFMPDDKEPATLVDDGVLTDAGRSEYAALFRRARPEQICGEASTAYTKRPTHEGVPGRAHALLGPDLRIIYIVREPVSRAISHHRHLAGLQQLPPAFDAALAQDATLIDYGRYAMQVEPWIETFGPDRVRVIGFEQFVKQRRQGVRDMCAFLGVEANDEQIDDHRVYNASRGKPQMVGAWRTLRSNVVYDRVVRPLLPRRVREMLRRALLPREAAPPAPPSAAALDRMITAFRSDSERLQQLAG